MAKLIEIPYRPREPQREMHSGIESHRFSVVVAHRRMGKTVSAINHLVKAAATCTKERPRLAYIAPQHNQAKAVAWDYLKHYTASVPGVTRNESELWVELPNKARIRLYGADNPDNLRGQYFDFVVMDEVAQMKPETWGEVVRPAIADRKGSVLFIGTPKGPNLFFELYQQAVADADWYAGFFPADQTGVLDEEELALARKAMSDAQYRQEFLCDFTSSSDDVLISLDVAQAASKREYKPEEYNLAPKVIGVDVARFGDDRSCVVVRHGLQVLDIQTFRQLDSMFLASTVANLIEEHKPDATFVDEGGLGGPIVDRLRQLGCSVIGVNNGGTSSLPTCKNKGAECWWRMKQWMEEGGAIPDSLELKSDLVGRTYCYDSQSRVQLESKESMKKRGAPSPDVADALALTFADNVAKPTKISLDRYRPTGRPT